MTHLHARALSLTRSSRRILSDIDISATHGCFLGIIGPNGAGKSSLLTLLAGLQPPTTGTVSLDDTPLPSWPRRDLARTRAYLPQHPTCDWPIPVASLVALGLTPSLPAFGALPSTPRRPG